MLIILPNRLEEKPTKYINFHKENIAYSSWIDSYHHYSLKIKYPLRNKPYTLFFETKGKLLYLKSGGVHINSFPLLCNQLDPRCVFTHDILLARHYMDIIFGIDFKSFILTYHTLTNSGKDFDLESPYSDMGTNFPLPQYEFLSQNYSLFHYLKVSWTFFD